MNHTKTLRESYIEDNLPSMRILLGKVCKTFVIGGTGLHLNPNFVLGGTIETDLFTKYGTWKTADDIGISGSDIQKDAAFELLAPVQEALTAAMKICNVQQLGVESKLKTSGGIIAKEGVEVGEMDQAAIIDITHVKGVDGMFKVDIQPSDKFCHGTIVRIINLATLAVREFQVHEKSHFKISDCTPGVHFSLQVAYDGTNSLRKWSDPKPFWGQ